MVDIIMHGCNGRMGQMITGLVAEDPDVRIVAGIDVAGGVESAPGIKDHEKIQKLSMKMQRLCPLQKGECI